MRSTPPPSLRRRVSPPASKRRRIEPSSPLEQNSPNTSTTDSAFPTAAAVEAGQASVRDHLSYFADQLSRCSRTATQQDETIERPAGFSSTVLSIEDYRKLFIRNADLQAGHHFVIHQHDHPRAGTHYDLRLQINEDSSCSWAIPYGLPGNPNERRHGRRQGIETRIHSLWNHLIEAASHKTGSMLIWDTGEYEILPYDSSKAQMTDDELSGVSTDDEQHHGSSQPALSETEKLSAAFRAGKIRIKLHGSRLPPGYTISIRLSNDNTKAKILGRSSSLQKPVRRKKVREKKVPEPRTTDDEDIADMPGEEGQDSTNLDSDAEDDLEHAAIRANNAYPGARNTIGSIHQRWWFVSIDKAACGFVKGRDQDGHVSWSPRDEATKRMYPFFVQGRDVERSVVTGRKAADVLKDEGVENYVFRGGWKPILM